VPVRTGLGQPQQGQVDPGILDDAGELDPDPDLTGTRVVVPPAEQLPRPPGTPLVDLYVLGLAGEDRCAVGKGA
jgi:hypothetical protein